MSKSKKKKKQPKGVSVLKEMDKTLNGTYEDLMEEIQDMQLQLALADQKARKKAKKKYKKDRSNREHQYISEQRKVREEVVQKMMGNSFLERVEKVFKDIAPIIVVIARLVASLILSILSLDIVKVHIKPEYLEKMNSVYTKAMAIS